MHTIYEIARAVFVVVVSLCSSVWTSLSSTSEAQPVVKSDPKRERFDMKVREDIFAGLAGDMVSFERGMKTCEQALAKNPKHAEAMVWHGCGTLFQSQLAFRKGDIATGRELWGKGMKEINRAVELEPNNLGTLIPRAATFLATAPYVPDAAQARSLLETGVADYEKVLELQRDYFPKLSVHSKGELLIALAEGHDRLGHTDKARKYYQRVANECRDSELPEYEKEAQAWLDAKDHHRPQQHTCVGCHIQ